MTTTTERTYPDNPGPLDADPATLDAILTGIEEFVAWAREHLDELRMFRHGHDFCFAVDGPRAVVDAVGALGLDAEPHAYGHKAVKHFSGGVTYTIWAPKSGEGS